jgi:predicted Rossmann fold nucleotide-binding protein DprA/Smf involved in DNA uptake
MGVRGFRNFTWAAPSFRFPKNFPIRNGIIGGMSARVLLAEGAQYSASDITPDWPSIPGRGTLCSSGQRRLQNEQGLQSVDYTGAKPMQARNDVIHRRYGG